MSNLQLFAEAYLKQGLCAIPCDKNKVPDLPVWAPFQTRLPRKDEINYNASDCLGIICGKVSGNLEVIDVDSKYDLTGTLKEDLFKAIPQEIISRCLVIQTRSGGLHIYYRCAEYIEGNKKLAFRPASDREIEDSLRENKKKPEKKAIIETRGEGGYVVAYPSDGYTILQKNAIPKLTVEERAKIIEACISFNEITEVPHEPQEPHEVKQYSGSGESPWVIYNRDGADHLINEFKKQGFTIPFSTKTKTFIRHPQATASTSGNLRHDINCIYFFSPNVPGFDAEVGYCLSEAYARLHNIDVLNDWRRLYDELRAQGYGSVYEHKDTGVSVKDGIKRANKILEETLEKEETEEEQKKSIAEHIFLIQSIKANNKFAHVVIDFMGVAEYFESSAGGKISEPAKQRVREILGITSWPKVSNEKLSVFKEDWIQRDLPECCYLYYKNGTVRITKDGYTFEKRDKTTTIWKSLVLPRDYVECENLHIVADLATKCIVNYQDFQMGLGYLLHRYWFRNITKIIWACDHNPKAGHDGRRGKDMFTTLVQECRNLTSVKWKRGHNFWTGSINPDTAIVHFEDTSNYLISDDEIKKAISGTLNIEGKGRDIITRQFKDKPKFSASCQTMPADYADNSIRGRVWMVEFTEYLQKNAPKEILVYDDNDKAPFDKWIIQCIQVYFQNIERMIGTPEITQAQLKEALRIRFGTSIIEAVYMCKLALDEDGYCPVKEVQSVAGVDEKNARALEKFVRCFELLEDKKLVKKRTLIHGERIYVYELLDSAKNEEIEIPF